MDGDDVAESFIGCVVFVVLVCVMICAVAGTVLFLRWAF